MKVGVVYAYQESKYSRPTPVIVLDTTHTYTRRTWVSEPYSAPAADAPAARHREYDEQMERAERSRQQTAWVRDSQPRVAKASGYGGANDHGYLVIGTGEWLGTFVQQAIKARGGMDAWVRHLRTISLEQVLAVTGADSTDGRVGDVPVGVINPRFLIGEWDVVNEERQAAEELAQDMARIAQEESDARVAQATERVEALRALSLPGKIDQPQEFKSGGSGTWKGNTAGVTLSLAQVDALLSLLPEGAVYVPPSDTEPDGWTYARPEYDTEGE